MYNNSPYYPGGFLSGVTPGARLIILINAIAFGVQIFCRLLQSWGVGPFDLWLTYYFALNPELVVNQFWLWQLLTCSILHGDPLHIIFNMLVVYFFGSEIEKYYGKKQLFGFYICCAIFASTIYVVMQYVLNTTTVALGASGATMGILVVVACLMPNQIVIFFLFPLRLVTVVLIMLGIDLYSLTVTPYGGASASAHLAGMLFGYLYFRYGEFFLAKLNQLENKMIARYEAEQRQSDRKMKAEVDRLLEKVNDEGISALSQAERDFLRKASKKYQKDL